MCIILWPEKDYMLWQGPFVSVFGLANTLCIETSPLPFSNCSTWSCCTIWEFHRVCTDVSSSSVHTLWLVIDLVMNIKSPQVYCCKVTFPLLPPFTAFIPCPTENLNQKTEKQVKLDPPSLSPVSKQRQVLHYAGGVFFSVILSWELS